VGYAGCGDSSGPDDPQPAGLIVAGGQNAAFPGDTFPLHTWSTDTGGAPLGLAPTGVSWTTSDPTIVEQISDSLFVAEELGISNLTAEVTMDGVTFSATREFHVIPAMSGRLVWGRQPDLGQPGRLVSRDLPGRAIVQRPQFGNVDATGFGSPALSPDARYVAIQAPRPISRVSDQAIYVIDLVTNTVAIRTDSMPGNQIAPRWSPGGDLVLFSSDAGGRWNIWSVPPAGGEPQQRVSLNATWPVFFDVSRSDGRLVIELTTPQGGSDLWEASLDTGVIGRITSSPEVSKFLPRVSPDGQTIVYAGSPDPSEGGTVLAISRTGGVPRALVPRVRVPNNPSLRTSASIAQAIAGGFSADGGFVLVTWLIDATYIPEGGGVIESWAYAGDIYAVSVDGGFRVRLTSWRWADVQADLR
jgi:dipeptidyl aminopeptidase/acylaminoacyl peptidase